MSLTTGARLGQYEVLSAIGAGGMGEVYRAKETKLNRDVAIKVLPAMFATVPTGNAGGPSVTVISTWLAALGKKQ